MNRRRWIIIVACCLLVIAVAVTVFLVNRKRSFDWTMQGYWVSADGTVREKVKLTVSGSVSKAKKGEDPRLWLEYNLPEGPYTTWPDSDGLASCVQRLLGVSYYGVRSLDADERMKYGVMASHAIDLEEEYLILFWENNTDEYLVAATNPDVDPTDILKHFELFMQVFAFD